MYNSLDTKVAVSIVLIIVSVSLIIISAINLIY
jgi:hypothetical protein